MGAAESRPIRYVRISFEVKTTLNIQSFNILIESEYFCHVVERAIGNIKALCNDCEAAKWSSRFAFRIIKTSTEKCRFVNLHGYLEENPTNIANNDGPKRLVYPTLKELQSIVAAALSNQEVHHINILSSTVKVVPSDL